MEDKRKVPVGVTPSLNTEGAPVTTGPSPDITEFVKPTHGEAEVPITLQGYIKQNPVAKLPNAPGMEPVPPVFESLESIRGNVIPIKQLREKSEGDAESGAADLARVRKRQLNRAA
ncbi:MAG: hypothetical protein HYW63_02210 [Candidatus Levybacteria bacterium]|nr:hypothetical protein [Candidatus Levybacteria bacterium]